MDALVLLRKDHRAIEAMFKSLQKGELLVVPKICADLAIHTRIEEDLFYPAVRLHAAVTSDSVLEAREEHQLVKVLIGELRSRPPKGEVYRAKAIVLMELVRHHVAKEEREMFHEARISLGRGRLRELGLEMDALKASLTRCTFATPEDGGGSGGL